MMRVRGTRTFQELRVGRNHSVEVVLFLRRSDLDWFQKNAAKHQDEICGLLSSSIIPRMCGEELERAYPRLFARGGGILAMMGEKNTRATNRSRKRRNKGGKKETVVIGRLQENDAAADPKKTKQVYYAFGENLHLAYRTKDIDQDSRSATLVFRSNINDDDNHVAKKTNLHCAASGDFHQLKKLSKRFLVWCYPLDLDMDDDGPEQEHTCGGFWRQEFIPIAHLFRSNDD